MSSNVVDLEVLRAEHMGPDAKIDVYLMLKEIDIAFTTRRGPDIDSAEQAIRKFCKHYKIPLVKGHNADSEG